MTAHSRLRPLLPFIAWLAAFYTTWLLLVVLGGHGAELANHWPIAVAMAAGSYVAGSTPMGGGTVGFPVLVLLLDMPAALGRDFSFAVQAIGMTSASIYILCRRQPLEVPMLKSALFGSLLGTPLGILFVAPLASDLFIKLLFATLWCSFGLLHLRHIAEISSREGMTPVQPSFDRRAGLIVGFFGGLTVASITGVGIDMMLYMVLVLFCHADLKIAIPTSVILMAFTSLVGVAVKFLLGGFEPGTFGQWLAAAPVVALGAPLGAWVVSRIGRTPTLVFVSLLCVLQFIWTLFHERAALSGWSLSLAFGGVVLFLLAFQEMRLLGNRLERRSLAAAPGKSGPARREDG
jgi:uncharacterized membrane protein YfcA